MNNYVDTLEIDFAFRKIESCFYLDPFSFLISKETPTNCLKPTKMLSNKEVELSGVEKKLVKEIKLNNSAI